MRNSAISFIQPLRPPVASTSCVLASALLLACAPKRPGNTPATEKVPTGAATPAPIGLEPENAAASGERSPILFPCQQDAQCHAHLCLKNKGHCAWPCRSNADCQMGFECMAPACVPTAQAPGAPAPKPDSLAPSTRRDDGARDNSQPAPPQPQ